MDFKNRHPLNAIDGYENLSMLEVLIPFVEPSLKLPLALFIKFSEIRLIIQCFRSIDNLTRLGLHNVTSDPMDMICALTGMSPDLLKTIFSMMDGNNNMFSDLFNNTDNSCGSSNNYDCSSNNLSNMMNLFQNMQSQTSANTSENTNHNNNSPTHQFSSDCTNDFEQNIQNILAQYDLEQAANYNGELDT
ncbi:MAG: hypothetical protein IJD40_03545 [Lachnospiraceae bacterium]|nr:hypothetical protein [Lachnospiraceae bacterium]